MLESVEKCFTVIPCRPKVPSHYYFFIGWPTTCVADKKAIMKYPTLCPALRSRQAFFGQWSPVKGKLRCILSFDFPVISVN